MVMNGLFQDFSGNGVAAANIPSVLSKDFLMEDFTAESRNDTGRSLSLDLSKEGRSSSGGGSVLNSASAEQELINQGNPMETLPLEGLESRKKPMYSPLSMGENGNSANNGGIDPNLLSNNLFMDTLGLSPSTEFSGTDQYSQQPSLNSLLDDYVSTEMLLNNENNQGPIQDAITSPMPELTDSRGSISHSVDFWNLPNNLKARRHTTGFTGIDGELADVLNGYHFNLRRNSFGNNVGGPTPTQSQRHGFKKQPQRSSMSVLDGSLNTDLFNKLYENGVPSSNLKLVSTWDQNNIGNDNNDDDQALNSMPNLEPMVSPKSPKTVIGNGHNTAQRISTSANQNFINPSMVLSDNASASAKVATTGNGASRDYDMFLNQRGIMRESPGPHAQGEANVPSPLIMPQEFSSPSSQEQETGTLGQQDPFQLTIQQPPQPKAIRQQSQGRGQVQAQAQAQSQTQAQSQAQAQAQSQAQAQAQAQAHLRSLSAPLAAGRRRSTANIMTMHNGNGMNVQNQPVPASRNNSRSITPMNTSDEDAKPFKCKECTKAFRRSEHLKRHIRSVHSSERPFACMFCEKKFSRSDNLSQHLKTHKKHGDF